MYTTNLGTRGPVDSHIATTRKNPPAVGFREAEPRVGGHRGIFSRIIVLGALAGVVTGCAAPQPDAALLQARADYSAAANDAGVVSMASDQLRQSQQALQQSEQALGSGGDMTVVDHYALLASRYAATAQQTARLKEAQQVVASAPVERSQAIAAAQATRAEQAEQQAQTAQQQAAAERQRAQQAEKELQTLQARQTAEGLVLSPREILFNPGSAVLQPGAEPAISRLAAFLRNNPQRQVLVEGFTDSTGSAALNQQLSEQRADAVRLALINDGVDASRIQIRGMSAAQPLASNDSAAGRLVNRRVQIVISNASEGFPAASGTTQR